MGPTRGIQGTAARSHQSAIEAAYDHWLREEHPDVNVVRDYRLALTRRISDRTGRPLEPATILDAHRLLVTFLRWTARNTRWTSASCG